MLQIATYCCNKKKIGAYFLWHAVWHAVLFTPMDQFPSTLTSFHSLLNKSKATALCYHYVLPLEWCVQGDVLCFLSQIAFCIKVKRLIFLALMLVSSGRTWVYWILFMLLRVNPLNMNARNHSHIFVPKNSNLKISLKLHNSAHIT